MGELVAPLEDVDSQRGVLTLKFSDILHLDGEGNPFKVQFPLPRNIAGGSITIFCYFVIMKLSQYGIHEASIVVVLHIDETILAAQGGRKSNTTSTHVMTYAVVLHHDGV